MNIRPLLGTAACLTLAGCAIKNPPAGADICTECGARANPRPTGVAAIAAARLCPTGFAPSATRNSPRSSKMRSCAIPTSKPPPRVWKRRATRCESPRRRSIRASRERPRRPTGTGVGWRPRSRDRLRRALAAYRESTTAAAAPRTPAWIHRRSAGSMASASARRGKLMCGAAFARRKRPRRPKATRSQRLRICPAVARRRRGARLFLHHRGRATGCERAGNARATTGGFEAHRRAQGAGPRERLRSCRRSSRAPPARRTRSTSRRPRERRPFARSKSSPATIPPAGSRTRSSFPGQPGAVPAGLPSQLLERRPDVIAAERRFAAAFHRVNEARAARLPRFAISAIGGLGTAQLDGVGMLNAFTWSLAAGITQPIFFGGELKAAQDIRTAEQKAAAASYAGVALRAFEDVEDALANDYYLRKREGALTEMVSSSADSREARRRATRTGQDRHVHHPAPRRRKPRREDSS